MANVEVVVARQMRHGRWLEILPRVGVLVLALGICFGIGILIPVQSPSESSTRSGAPAASEVLRQSTDFATRSSLSISWSATRSFFTGASFPSGTVTHIDLSSSEIECGQSILRVDRVPLVAYCADAPLTSPTLHSLSGEEQASLEQFLDEQLSPESSSPSGLTERWQRFSSNIAADQPFSLHHLVWIGTTGLRVIVIPQVGELLGPSSEIAVSIPQVEAANVVIPSWFPSDRQAVFVPSDWPETALAISSEGAVENPQLLSDELSSRDATQEEVPELLGQILLESPIEVFAVPVSSLINAGGRTCVAVLQGPTDEPQNAISQTVEVLGSSGGSLYVGGDLETGESVAIPYPFPESTCLQ